MNFFFVVFSGALGALKSNICSYLVYTSERGSKALRLISLFGIFLISSDKVLVSPFLIPVLALGVIGDLGFYMIKLFLIT